MSCPTDETLSLLAHGRLQPEALESVEAHLDTCASCRSLVAAVSTGSAPYSQPERMAFRTGERLGRYEIDTLLAAGGMGMLYTARDTQLNRRAVLKLMRPAFGGELGKLRLLREAQAMASLSHPNVVSVFELGESDGRVFMAMELVEGGTLRDWMKSPGSWKDVVAMMVQAGRGLAAAHQAGVIHRDFKPENVLVGRDGRPRVADFGLARPELVAEEELPRNAPMRITHTGTMLGTPAYMSPEQLAGKPADARSDQYSFCVTLYEALVGKRPFPADTVEELRARVAGGMPPPPKDGPVPAHVWAAIARGLHPLPERRFPDVESLLEVLGASIPALALPSMRRWPRALGVVAAALVTLGLTGGVVTWVVAAKRAPLPVAAPAALPTHLVLSQAQQLSLDVPGLQRVETYGAALAGAQQLGTRLVLTGGEPGQATVMGWLAGGRVWTAVVEVPSPPPLAPPPDALRGLPNEIQLAPYEERTFQVPGLLDASHQGHGVSELLQDGETLTVIADKSGISELTAKFEGGFVWKARVEVGPPAAEEVLPETVNLELGAERRFKFYQLNRIAVGDASIADVETHGQDTVHIRATGLGRTTLIVWTPSRRFEATVVVAGPLVARPGAALTLQEGQQKVISVPNLTRLAVGDADVADVKTIGNDEVLIIGANRGHTTLLVWQADGKRVTYAINVTKPAAVPGVVPVRLEDGESQQFPIPGIQRCAISDAAVASVECTKGTLSINALKTGTATLRVWKKGGTVSLFAVQVL